MSIMSTEKVEIKEKPQMSRTVKLPSDCTLTVNDESLTLDRKGNSGVPDIAFDKIDGFLDTILLTGYLRDTGRSISEIYTPAQYRILLEQGEDEIAIEQFKAGPRIESVKALDEKLVSYCVQKEPEILDKARSVYDQSIEDPELSQALADTKDKYNRGLYKKKEWSTFESIPRNDFEKSLGIMLRLYLSGEDYTPTGEEYQDSLNRFALLLFTKNFQDLQGSAQVQ